MFDAFTLIAQQFDPTVRFDWDDVLGDVLTVGTALALMRMLGIRGVRSLLSREFARKEGETTLLADPKSHEIEGEEGMGPVRIIVANGTVRVEPIE